MHITTPDETDGVSIARLHGEACWHCGAVYCSLTPTGPVIVGGREWQTVSCVKHEGRPLADGTRSELLSSHEGLPL